jgi:hypothetical protein
MAFAICARPEKKYLGNFADISEAEPRGSRPESSEI